MCLIPGPSVVCAKTIETVLTVGVGVWILRNQAYSPMRGTVPFTWSIARSIGAESRKPNSIHVYRLYGSDWRTDPHASGPYGASWTTIDPRTMFNARNYLGLPDSNKGDRLVEGDVFDFRGVGFRYAEEMGENTGGAPELVITDAATRVKNKRHSRFKPRSNQLGSGTCPHPMIGSSSVKCGTDYEIVP